MRPESPAPVWMPIDHLRPDPNNPRQISPEQFERLRASLREFGAVEPAVVNTFPGEEGTIIGGHQRIAAAEAEGWSDYPCVPVSLPPARARALNLALNRISGEWGPDEQLAAFLAAIAADDPEAVALTGFTEQELGRLLAELPPEEPPATDVPEQPTGGYGVLIACADAQEQQRVMNDLAAMGFACTPASTEARPRRKKKGR